MKTITAQYNWVKGNDLRMDAAYHLSDGRISKMVIENSPWRYCKLADVTKSIFYGGRAKRNYVSNKDNGIPFMGSSDMLKSDFSSLKYISKKHTKNLNSYFLEEGWTLVSRSGTIGNTVYVNKNFLGKAASEDIIRIVPNAKVKSGFLYSFLSSKYGYALLTQGTFGTVIQHIEPDYLSSLPIPIFPKTKEKKIHNLIVEASNLRVKSNEYLYNSTFFFEKQFNNVYSYKKTFTKNINNFNFSWVGRNNDIVAESFINQIKSKKYFYITDKSSEVFAPSLFKHIYLSSDNGNPFYTGNDLLRSYRPKKRYLSTRGVRNISDYKVERGTLIIYKSGPRDGMIGSVFLVDESINGGCLSDHVIRVNIEDKEINNWVFAFLKSKVGLRILHNLATGTAILFITPERISNIAIPYPDENLKFISDNIDKYLEFYEKAHNFENQAIKFIENEISSWQK